MSGVTQRKGIGLVIIRGAVLWWGGASQKRVILTWRNSWKALVSWSEANSEPCQTLVTELKPLPILEKGSIRFYRVLNASLVMTVARHWESVSTKTKVLFSVLIKKTQSTFVLVKGNTYKMNDSTNEKSVILFDKSKNTAIVEWNEDTTI